jgi:hypothetical protein
LHAYQDCPISRVHKRRAKNGKSESQSCPIPKEDPTVLRKISPGSRPLATLQGDLQRLIYNYASGVKFHPSTRTFLLGLSRIRTMVESAGLVNMAFTTCQAGEERRMCVYSMYGSSCGSLSSLHKPHLSRQHAFPLPLITPKDYQHGQSSRPIQQTYPHSV